jgi:uncharacterized Fe-S center protein
MINQEDFVEVFKSINEKDFEKSQELVTKLGALFENKELRKLFSEEELSRVSEMLGKYDDEVIIATVVSKFKQEV